MVARVDRSIDDCRQNCPFGSTEWNAKWFHSAPKSKGRDVLLRSDANQCITIWSWSVWPFPVQSILILSIGRPWTGELLHMPLYCGFQNCKSVSSCLHGINDRSSSLHSTSPDSCVQATYRLFTQQFFHATFFLFRIFCGNDGWDSKKKIAGKCSPIVRCEQL